MNERASERARIENKRCMRAPDASARARCIPAGAVTSALLENSRECERERERGLLCVFLASTRPRASFSSFLYASMRLYILYMKPFMMLWLNCRR